MPAAARKSSLGMTRRALPKAHIPYRGDNPNVGKKTGITIRNVERKSDGFEPFDEILGQADKRTPPRVKKRKSNARRRDWDSDEDEEEFEDDEYGEMSMDVDSPIHQASNMRAPTTPTGRAAARPVARTSSVDFDKIPSPRNNSRALTSKAGPSRLRRSMIPEDHEPSFEPGEQSQEEEDMTMDMDTTIMSVATTALSVGVGRGGRSRLSEYAPPTTAGGESPQHNSFTEMNQDDDDDDEHFPFIEPEGFSEPPLEPEPEVQEEDEQSEPTPPPEPSSKKGKGKATARVATPPPEDDFGVEDEIERGLQEVDQNQQPSDGEEPEPVPKKKMKVKLADQEPPSKKRTKSANKKENRPHPDGVRRSNRNHYGPLEWWRGERVVYGRLEFEEPVLVPEIKEIIRIPKETPEPLSQKRKRGRSRSRTVGPGRGTTADLEANPEAGWDEDTKPDAMVLDYVTGEDVEKRIAWPSSLVNPQQVANGDWSYQKILWDSDFIAAGQLVIPPKCRKPSKGTKDNTYIFYIIEGAINLKIHDTSLVLATGAVFMVPRGNTYFIENISQRNARLFFTQARKTINNEEETLVALQNRAKRRASRSRRSESEGRGEGSVGPLHGVLRDPEEEREEETPRPTKKKKGKA